MAHNMMDPAGIRVPERFKQNPPKAGKIAERKEALSGDPAGMYVRVNGAGWLTDCYATYVAAMELGLARIRVKPGREDCLVAFGSYHAGGKEYAWEVPASVEKAWADRGTVPAAGMPLAVRDSKGAVRAVKATRFERMPWPTGHGEIIGMWSRKTAGLKRGHADGTGGGGHA